MKKSILWVAFMVLAATTFVSCGSAKKTVKKDMGIQLYSLRNEFANCNGNYMPILEDLAKWGYTSVEAASYDQGNGLFYGSKPEEFKKNVESVGMKVLSSHTTRNLSAEEIANHDFTAALEWWKKAIADHKAAGMEYIVTPWLSVPATLAELKTICEYMNEVGKLCAEAGLKYGYHSHSHEFKKVEDKVMLKYMLENTDPKYVFFELDVYWCVIGQAAPVEYFREYPGRFTMLHIKDLCTVGESGMVGFDAIFANAELAGMKDFIVEVECDPRPSVENSAKYLLNADFVKTSYRDQK